MFGPADRHRRQVAQLATRLAPSGAIRLERLRGFGAPLGALMTCGCARLEFADGDHGILIAAALAADRGLREVVQQLRPRALDPGSPRDAGEVGRQQRVGAIASACVLAVDQGAYGGERVGGGPCPAASSASQAG